MTDKTEIQLLKEKADEKGIVYKGNISLVALKELVYGDLVKAEVEVKEEPKQKLVQRQGTPAEVAKDKAVLRQHMIAQKRKEANRLVRVRITCMNPDRTEHPGEIFTVANNVVGTVRKYVPFGADEGWYVPQMILNVMKERKCQVFTNKRLPNGQTIKKGKLVNEFAIEYLDDLTAVELETHKTKQLAEQSLQD